MNTLTGIFPKIDPVSAGLCSIKIALQSDYDDRKHDIRFDIVPSETEVGEPSLWSVEHQIEIEYIGTNAYKTTIRGVELIGSLNDTRVIIWALSERAYNHLRYNK